MMEPNALFLFIVISLEILYFVPCFFVLNWVYKDAQKHGKSPLIWVYLVLFTGWIGLGVYILLRNVQFPKKRIDETKKKNDVFIYNDVEQARSRDTLKYMLD